MLNIQNITKTLKIIDFSNTEIEATCALMHEDKRYHDLGDTLQYILAKKHRCDLILSNDQSFVSLDIPLVSSEAFCKRHQLL